MSKFIPLVPLGKKVRTFAVKQALFAVVDGEINPIVNECYRADILDGRCRVTVYHVQLTVTDHVHLLNMRCDQLLINENELAGFDTERYMKLVVSKKLDHLRYLLTNNEDEDLPF